jgi:hypothetical protein
MLAILLHLSHLGKSMIMRHARRGIFRDTRVPAAGDDSIAIEAPSRAARARMLERP